MIKSSQNNNLAKSLSDAERKHLLHIVQLDAMTGNKESEVLHQKLRTLLLPAPRDPANYTGVLSNRNWT